jgi:hypothetical protein
MIGQDETVVNDIPHKSGKPAGSSAGLQSLCELYL